MRLLVYAAGIGPQPLAVCAATRLEVAPLGHRVLDVGVSEVMLDGPRVAARQWRAGSHPVPVPSAVRSALARFDAALRATGEWQGWEQNKAHKYAIEVAGRLYPVSALGSCQGSRGWPWADC